MIRPKCIALSGQELHRSRVTRTHARRRAFGEMEVRGMELVVGDWYQSADRTRVVDAHPLTG